MKRELENEFEREQSFCEIPTEVWVETLVNLLSECTKGYHYIASVDELVLLESLRLVNHFLCDTIDSLVMSLVRFLPVPILERMTARSLSRFTGLKRVVITENLPTCVIDALPGMSRLGALNLCANLVTDTHLACLTQLTELCVLAFRACNIGNPGLFSLTNLVTLQLGDNRHVTDEALGRLINLTHLDLERNRVITDAGISTLTCLTWLSLQKQRHITDNGLRSLTGLTSLSLLTNKRVTNTGLSCLTNLVDLDLENNSRITDAALFALTSLTCLDIRWASGISDSSLSRLTNLTELSVGWSRDDADEVPLARVPTDASIRRLSCLRELLLEPGNNRITGHGISRLTALTSLCVRNNDEINDAALRRLINLTRLDVSDTIYIHQIPRRLTALRHLDISFSGVEEASLAYLTNLVELNAANYFCKEEDIVSMRLERMQQLDWLGVCKLETVPLRIQEAIIERGGEIQEVVRQYAHALDVDPDLVEQPDVI